MTRTPPRFRLGRTLALGLTLVVLSFAFRLPALVNAGTVDSDAAIVGLQARHILHHDAPFSFFLYGSGYQTSVDSCVAALFFALLGAGPLPLVLSTLVGHVVATCLAFLTLRRHLAPAAAFVATLPLVFTSSPLHTYILNPPRQAALTLVFAALFVLDGAPLRATARARSLHLALGSALASLACFADPYALLFLPPLLAFGVFTGARPRFAPFRAWLRASVPVAVVAGALVGIVPFVLLVNSPRAVHGETKLTLDVVGHNLALLGSPCLPWLLGAEAYVPKALLGYVPWEPARGGAMRCVQIAGAGLFLFAIATGALAAFVKRVPRALRLLGAFGAVVAAMTLASFLLSVMVMDLFSSRYLAALVLASPFALAPLAYAMGARRLFAWLAPFLLSAAVAGWVGFGDEVAGLRVVRLPGGGSADEAALEGLLRARGVQTAIADYWVAYRLTFLYDEAIAVVPIHAREDRYAPYRAAFERARVSAYVFDPMRSREDREAMEREAFEGARAWGRPVERLRVGSLTAVVFEPNGTKE